MWLKLPRSTAWNHCACFYRESGRLKSPFNWQDYELIYPFNEHKWKVICLNTVNKLNNLLQQSNTDMVSVLINSMMLHVDFALRYCAYPSIVILKMMFFGYLQRTQCTFSRSEFHLGPTVKYYFCTISDYVILPPGDIHFIVLRIFQLNNSKEHYFVYELLKINSDHTS